MKTKNYSILAKNTAFWQIHGIWRKSRFPWFPCFRDYLLSLYISDVNGKCSGDTISVQVDDGLGELNPAKFSTPHSFYMFSFPGGQLSPPSRFLATSRVFAIKMHKTLHFLLENSPQKIYGRGHSRVGVKAIPPEGNILPRPTALVSSGHLIPCCFWSIWLAYSWGCYVKLQY